MPANIFFTLTKNLIGYLSYLVKVKKMFACIELYFLIVGHTKFGPDSQFGVSLGYRNLLPHGPHIQVAPKINTLITDHRILDGSVEINGEPMILQPEPVKENREKNLKFFEDFVPTEHKEFMSKIY